MEASSLPWEQESVPHPDAGWKVKTERRVSTIPNSGHGRFMLEDVPKGTIIREVTIVDVSRAKETEADFKPRLGTVLLFHNKEELLSTFKKLAQDGKRSNLYEQIGNFGFVPEDVTGTQFDREQAMFYYVPSVNINHQPDGGANASIVLRGQESKLFIIATRYIPAGGEMFEDYREMPAVPAWYKEFCGAKSLTDLTSFGYMLNPR